MKTLNYITITVILIFVGFVAGVILTSKNKVKNTPPVEEIIKADSIIKVNDSIKIKIENLDSIKNAKVIEVQSLDNDSTVKLFYKLIGK